MAYLGRPSTGDSPFAIGDRAMRDTSSPQPPAQRNPTPRQHQAGQVGPSGFMNTPSPYGSVSDEARRRYEERYAKKAAEDAAKKAKEEEEERRKAQAAAGPPGGYGPPAGGGGGGGYGGGGPPRPPQMQYGQGPPRPPFNGPPVGPPQQHPQHQQQQQQQQQQQHYQQQQQPQQYHQQQQAQHSPVPPGGFPPPHHAQPPPRGSSPQQSFRPPPGNSRPQSYTSPPPNHSPLPTQSQRFSNPPAAGGPSGGMPYDRPSSRTSVQSGASGPQWSNNSVPPPSQGWQQQQQHQQQHQPPPPQQSRSPVPEPPRADDDELMDMFHTFDSGRNGQLSSLDLQNLLAKDSMMDAREDCVKMLMNIFDTDRSGSINFMEFEGLYRYIQDWYGIFLRFDRDGSGLIDRKELHQALLGFGFSLPPELVRKIEKRYAPPPKANKPAQKGIAFDRFLMACVTVKHFTEAFRRMDPNGTGRVNMDYNTFMELVLDAPS